MDNNTTIRKAFWKKYAREAIRKNKNYNISNLINVALYGENPVIDKKIIELHCVVGHQIDPKKLSFMDTKNHKAFHKEFGVYPNEKSDKPWPNI